MSYHDAFAAHHRLQEGGMAVWQPVQEGAGLGRLFSYVAAHRHHREEAKAGAQKGGSMTREENAQARRERAMARIAAMKN